MEISIKTIIISVIIIVAVTYFVTIYFNRSKCPEPSKVLEQDTFNRNSNRVNEDRRNLNEPILDRRNLNEPILDRRNPNEPILDRRNNSDRYTQRSANVFREKRGNHHDIYRD